MATDLATLLQQIPLAEDGRLITRDYHNSLRAALLALAASINSSAKAANQLVLLPRFLRSDGEKAGWGQDGSKAVSSGRGASGILPIDLRDNEQIDSVLLTGRVGRSGLQPRDGSGGFELVLQSVTDPRVVVRSALDERNVKLDANGEFVAVIEAGRGNIEIGRLPERGAKSLAAASLCYLQAEVPEGVELELWSVVVNFK